MAAKDGIRQLAVRVPDELVVKFDRYFPASGSKQWFFAACMETAVRLVEEGELETPEQALDRVVANVGARIKRF